MPEKMKSDGMKLRSILYTVLKKARLSGMRLAR